MDPLGVEKDVPVVLSPLRPPFEAALAAFSARRFCLDAEGAMSKCKICGDGGNGGEEESDRCGHGTAAPQKFSKMRHGMMCQRLWRRFAWLEP